MKVATATAMATATATAMETMGGKGMRRRRRRGGGSVNNDKIIALALPASQCNNQLNMKTMTTAATLGRRVGEDCGEVRAGALQSQQQSTARMIGGNNR